jgi:hypothetical protein
MTKSNPLVRVCKKLRAIYVGMWTVRKVGCHKTIIKEVQACNLHHYEVLPDAPIYVDQAWNSYAKHSTFIAGNLKKPAAGLT